MRWNRYWVLFAACALAWLAVNLILPPAMSGTDVFIFRDAGWNLAAYGSFKSAGLMYMPDLVPRLYAHYTPMMPLLFAGYASIFPRNAYAGTVFNLLLGLLGAGVALRWVLGQPEGRLRNWAALAVAILPVAFITYDRPEAIAFVLFIATVAAAASPRVRPVVVGLLIALTFLAHPFYAVASAVWVTALFFSRNWNTACRWRLTPRQIVVAGAAAVIPIAAVALLFYTLDPTSLMRFATHALGMHSGLNRIKSGGWLESLHWAAFGVSPVAAWTYLASLASIFVLLAWSVSRRRELGAREWLPIAAGCACVLISIAVFSFQYIYITSLSICIPVALLVASRQGAKLAAPGLALLLFAVLIRVPDLGFHILERTEQGPSYRAALGQPATLRAQLPSPDDIVTLEGGSYDLFKPEFHSMIHLTDAEDLDHFSKLDGVANCYDGFHGSSSSPRPFPAKLNAADFHLIEPAPRHLWVTLFGHRIMHAQWGFGCDLYVRNNAANAKSEKP
ncbi:MAG: hypothetical protein WBE76_00780 [Terracidiphilus sp.]